MSSISTWGRAVIKFIAPEQEYGEAGTLGQRDRKAIAYRPEFYLVYLVFYFVPWIFRAPALIDILVAIASIVVFIPIYFRACAKMTKDYIPHMLVMELIAFATMPFHGMSGTFHIYAACQAGFQQDKRVAILFLCSLTVVWILFSMLMQRHISEIGFVSFIAIISAIGCMGSAEQILFGQSMKRNRVLDQQLAAVAERERIARDLHDLLGHTLTMVSLKSEVAEKLIENNPDRALMEIREIREASRSALKDVRQTIAGMVETSLTLEVSHAQKALSAADIEFELVGIVPSLPHRVSMAAGLAVREAVTNIIRHSQAKSACLEIHQDDEIINITVRDNGLGSDQPEGNGLSGLRQRIENLGGRVSILSEKGMALTMSVPAKSQLAKHPIS